MWGARAWRRRRGLVEDGFVVVRGRGPCRPTGCPDRETRTPRRPGRPPCRVPVSVLAGRDLFQRRRAARPGRRRPGPRRSASWVRPVASECASSGSSASGCARSWSRSRAAWPASAVAVRAESGTGTGRAGGDATGAGSGVGLFEDHVGVGAADPERRTPPPGADARPPATVAASVSSATAPAVQSTCGVGSSTCRVPGQHAVPHRHRPS